MTRDTLFYKILSGIHVVFFVSILFGLTIVLSASLLYIPALGALFFIGKDYIDKKLNINDSIVKLYFRYLKESISLVKCVPVHIILLLNIVGFYVAMEEYKTIGILCLMITAVLLVFTLYIAGYFVFIYKKVDLLEMSFFMLFKPQFLILLFMIMVVFCVFISMALLTILLFTGAFFLFALEVVIFIQSMYFRKLTGGLSEEEEYAYLVFGKKK